MASIGLLVDGVIDVYSRKKTLKQLQDVDRRRVGEIIKQLPGDLPLIDEHNLTLKREIIRVLNIASKGKFYTETERLEAVKRVVKGEMKPEAAFQKFGVPTKTLYNTRKALAAELRDLLPEKYNCTSDLATLYESKPDLVIKTIENLDISKRGPKHHMSQIELDIFSEVCTLQGHAGYGLNQNQIRKRVAQFIQVKGQDELDQAELNGDERGKAKAMKMIKTEKVSKHWVRKNLGSTVSSAGGQRSQGRVQVADPNRKTPFQKVSDISTKRAAGASPVKDMIMREKFQNQYIEHHKAGILKTPQPTAKQVLFYKAN